MARSLTPQGPLDNQTSWIQTRAFHGAALMVWNLTDFQFERASDLMGGPLFIQQCKAFVNMIDCVTIQSAVEAFKKRVSWTPIFRPLVKFDFCRSAVDKKEQTYESKTEKTQCGLQGQ
ncbi:MAG: hypothetical protein ACLQU4_08090, partial [Limisphaerales bacterium]